MLTQYYIPGQPQKPGKRGGGLGALLLFLTIAAAIGVAYYKSPFRTQIKPLAKSETPH
jgi:uncharacterized protein HemX